jgi:hypothetical protein
MCIYSVIYIQKTSDKCYANNTNHLTFVTEINCVFFKRVQICRGYFVELHAPK